MGVKFANSAYATLASSITSSATSITLTTGQGARFPSLGAGDYFYATLIDTSNNLEIVKCTARSTDVLTVVRGQESTTARAYSAGDRIELRITAQGIVDSAPVTSVAGRTGAVTLTASDVSGLATIATSGSASDLGSGTVPKARMYAGAVLQAVQNTEAGIVSYTNSNGTFITVNITPSFSSSKILVSGYYIWSGDNPNGYFALERSINGGGWTGLANVAGYDEVAANGNGWSAPVNYLDSPNTTSMVTYRVYWYHIGQNGGTMYMNRSFTNDNNTFNTSRTGRTVLVVQEIAG